LLDWAGQTKSSPFGDRYQMAPSYAYWNRAAVQALLDATMRRIEFLLTYRAMVPP